MSLTLLTVITHLFFTHLFFIFTATTTATTTSPENLIATLKSKNITSVHLPSTTPETISSFSNTNISLLLTIPNSLIPTISSNPSATSAWLSSHVTPSLPHVRISAISLGNNVMDANILKLLLPAVDNVKEKVMEFGIKEIKVSTTVSLKFINCGSNTVSKGLLGGLSEKNATLFVNVKPWNVSFKKVVCGGFALMRDLSTDVGYKSVENGEMMDYGVVEARVSKVEDKEKVNKDNGDVLCFLLLICFVYIFLF